MLDNQTNEDWLKLPTVSGDPNPLGTGVDLFRAGGGKDLIGDITYDDMLRRDQQANLFLPSPGYPTLWHPTVRYNNKPVVAGVRRLVSDRAASVTAA